MVEAGRWQARRTTCIGIRRLNEMFECARQFGSNSSLKTSINTSMQREDAVSNLADCGQARTNGKGGESSAWRWQINEISSI